MRNAYATGSATFNSVNGTIPVNTNETPTYRTVQMNKETSSPIGTLRCGRFTSSAAVATASNPKKAKNTVAAPPTTPWKPNGRNGCQFSGLTYCVPTTINPTITASLIITIILFIRALSFAPRLNKNVTTKIIRTAGKSMIPPFPIPGAEAKIVGMWILKPSSNDWKYADQPAATAEVANKYSSITHQPTINAKISPSVIYVYEYTLPETGTVDANSA